MTIRFLIFFVTFNFFSIIGQGNIGSLIKDPFSDTTSTYKPIICYPSTNEYTARSEKSVALNGLVDLLIGGTKTVLFKSGIGGVIYLKKDNFHLRLGGLAWYNPIDSVFIQNNWQLANSKQRIDPFIRASYSPSKHLNLQAGFDKNFYGEGLRSLFVSDYGKAYPFVSTKFNAGPLRYQCMGAFLQSSAFENKFNISHLLDFRIGNNLHLQFFETVVFTSRDSITHRNFEPEYLNPFIFLRPQEYAIGSSDNILMGIGGVYTFKKNTFYGQLIVDEFLLSAIKESKKYWGNKYGVQLGYKLPIKVFGTPSFVRVEANWVRPYTYSHIGDALNYYHSQLSIAHPLGSNFWECLLEFKFKKKKWWGNYSFIIGQQGLDSTTVNFGSNPLLPYTTRPFDNGVIIGQGLLNTFSISQLQFGYTLVESIKLSVFFEALYRFEKNTTNQKNYIIPLIGVRTNLWNDYRNY